MKHILSLYFMINTCFLNVVIGQNLINIPDTLSGNEISLILSHGVKEFYSGIMTNTLGYNGSYLGKTIVLYKGQKVKFNVYNGLQEPTSTHWHGLHVTPHNDGSPHTPIVVGTTWSPEFTVMDKAGTYWYHPHLHEKTLKQVVKGAAGLIIVRDEEEAMLELPRTYGIDDIPLIFQFQTFDNSKQIVEDDDADNAILVNGTLNGKVNCPAQMVRLRLLNASSHRVFRFGFENNLAFYQIVSDAGLLNKPVQMTRLNLGSGERAEIIIDLSTLQGKSIKLRTFGNELNIGFPGGPSMMGMPVGPLDNKTTDILTINVKDKLLDAVTTLPQRLTTNNVWSEVNVSNRIFNFSAQPMMSMDNFFINNSKYDSSVINFKTKLNNTEIWTLSNQTMMAHPFHIHGNHFYILSINGQEPPENLKGRKDVVLVPPMNGSVKLITKYEDFSDSHMPYMYHCHILSHEDKGMMGQFIVENSTTNSENIKDKEGINIFYDRQNLIINSLNETPMSRISISDVSGKVLYNKLHHELGIIVNTSTYSNGIYVVTIYTGNNVIVKKVLIY